MILGCITGLLLITGCQSEQGQKIVTESTVTTEGTYNLYEVHTFGHTVSIKDLSDFQDSVISGSVILNKDKTGEMLLSIMSKSGNNSERVISFTWELSDDSNASNLKIAVTNGQSDEMQDGTIKDGVLSFVSGDEDSFGLSLFFVKPGFESSVAVESEGIKAIQEEYGDMFTGLTIM